MRVLRTGRSARSAPRACGRRWDRSPSPGARRLRVWRASITQPQSPRAKRHPTAPRDATVEAFRFAKAINDAGALYFQVNPQVGAFVDAMLTQDLAYLVYENLNESWSALYHADVVADFASTQLSYACSAHIAADDETSIPLAPTSYSPASRTASGARR